LIEPLGHGAPHRDASFIAFECQSLDLFRNECWAALAMVLLNPKRDAPQFLVTG
jgi:hypothetical protein